MNSRIEVILNWDETYSVKLDGELVLVRKSRQECDQKAAFLDAFLTVDSFQKVVIPSQNEKPDTIGTQQPPSGSED